MAPHSEESVTKSTDQAMQKTYENYDTYLKLPSEIGTDYNFKHKVVWFNAIGFLILHLAAVYGVYLCFFTTILSTLYMALGAIVCSFGVTLGAHRLYTHKSYKAKWPLRLVLNVLQTAAGQNCLYIWVRDHRQHHKYSDTDADPHNAHRGFFFSHIGWLMTRKHPAVISKGKTIDMSDLEADPIVMWQKTYYKPLYVVFALILPICIPYYWWDETLWNCIFIGYFARYILLLNATWFVNSWAHLWGSRPFDKTLLPVESHFVAFIALGEGWHNYHHAFPWDYRCSEFGALYNLNAFMIEMFAAIGQAYDLRTAPYSMVEYRSLRAGDGSHHLFGKQAKEIQTVMKYKQTNRTVDLEVREEKVAELAGEMAKAKNVMEAPRESVAYRRG